MQETNPWERPQCRAIDLWLHPSRWARQIQVERGVYDTLTENMEKALDQSLNLKNELDTAHSAIAGMRVQLDEANHLIDTLRQQVSQLQAENARSRSETEELGREFENFISQAEEYKQKQQNRIALLRDRIVTLREMLHALDVEAPESELATIDLETENDPYRYNPAPDNTMSESAANENETPSEPQTDESDSEGDWVIPLPDF